MSLQNQHLMENSWAFLMVIPIYGVTFACMRLSGAVQRPSHSWKFLGPPSIGISLQQNLWVFWWKQIQSKKQVLIIRIIIRLFNFNLKLINNIYVEKRARNQKDIVTYWPNDPKH